MLRFPHIPLGLLLISTEESSLPFTMKFGRHFCDTLKQISRAKVCVQKSLNRMTQCPEQALLSICLNLNIFWKSSSQFGVQKSSQVSTFQQYRSSATQKAKWTLVNGQKHSCPLKSHSNGGECITPAYEQHSSEQTNSITPGPHSLSNLLMKFDSILVFKAACLL